MANLPTVPWDESVPDGATEFVDEGDNRIRELKTQVREVVGVDHEFEVDEDSATAGRHTIIKFVTQDDAPSMVVDTCQIYQKDISDDETPQLELFIKDAAGNEVQLTEGGVFKDLMTLSTAQTLTGDKTLSSNINVNQYIIGTVSVGDGSQSVTGSGTAWLTNAKAGMAILFEGEGGYYYISSIDADNALTLNIPKVGTVTNSNYIISPVIGGIPVGLHKALTTIDHPDSSITSDKIKDAAVILSKLGTGTLALKTGKYTGDGTSSQAITGVGFQPSILIVFCQKDTSGSLVWLKTDQDTTYSKCLSLGEYKTSRIVSLDSDGFTVGDGGTGTGGDLNYKSGGTGDTYTYIALGARA